MSKRNRGNRVQTQAPPKSVQDRQLRMLRVSQLSARITSGPIPSADEMERYRNVQADFPERIMRDFERRTELAEAQSVHRMGLERTVVGNNVLMERLGWFSASFLGVGTIGGSIWLIYAGKSLEGLAGIVLALGALLGLYVWGRRDQVQAVARKAAAEIVQSGATPEQLDLLSPGPDA
jgi:hypothetical protein